jgi:uncharacterized protein
MLQKVLDSLLTTLTGERPMKPSEALQLHREDIRHIVEQHHAKNPRVFGSVIVGQDTEDSDLDLLVDTTKETTIFDIAKIQNQLQKLLNVPVDVLTPKGIHENFRARVLKEAVPV